MPAATPHLEQSVFVPVDGTGCVDLDVLRMALTHVPTDVSAVLEVEKGPVGYGPSEHEDVTALRITWTTPIGAVQL